MSTTNNIKIMKYIYLIIHGESNMSSDDDVYCACKTEKLAQKILSNDINGGNLEDDAYIVECAFHS